MGRDDDLVSVDALLRQNQQVNIAAAVGMGGVGKTELALQYALRYGDQFPGGVCWLDGQVPISAQMIAFAQIYLGLVVPENTEDPVAWCCQRWPGNGPVLMVVDDVQDYGLLKPLLPNNPRFRVLLTTRQAILPLGQCLPLDVLTPGTALELLQSGVGPERIKAEPTEANALCERMGRLPLGLELVGYYLRLRPELTIARLLQRLEAKKLEAKALVDTYPGMTADLGVAAAFELSWEPLSEETQLVAAALGLFAAAPVVWAWVDDTLKGLKNEDWDEEALEDARVELLRVHFLKATGIGSTTRYEVHPLVREFFAAKRSTLPAADPLTQGFAQTMVNIAKNIPQTVTLDVQARVAEAVPHLEVATAQCSKILQGADKIWYSTGLARFHHSLQHWANAETYYRQALTISQTQLGERNPATATALNNLASLYKDRGLYKDAKTLFQQALAIRHSELGDCHPDTADTLNNLASLHYYTGHHKEAESLFKKALKIWELEPEKVQLNIANGLNNLALLYRDIGRDEEAEPLFQQALSIRQPKLGDHHPDTAQSLNNLALIYYKKGQYKEAEILFQKALKIWESKLGEMHLDIARVSFNLANLYHKTQHYIQAFDYILKAQKIYIFLLGVDAPERKKTNEIRELIYNNLRFLQDI